MFLYSMCGLWVGILASHTCKGNYLTPMLSSDHVCNTNTVFVIFHSEISRDFLGRPISAGVFWGGL